MKNFKARLAALCALMVLTAAGLAPMAAQAQAYGPVCPSITFRCSQTKTVTCFGIRQGDKCVYSLACLNCQV